MKLLSVIQLILLLISTAGAQEKPLDPEALKAGIEVAEVHWSDHSSLHEGQAWFAVLIWNRSDKWIRYVEWDFILLDTVRDREYDHLKFKTDSIRVVPGDWQVLRKDIDFAKTPNYIEARVEIRMVRFDDGSEWVRPEKRH